MYNHLGGGHRMAGKRTVMITMFVVLANSGYHCQIRCPEDQAGSLKGLLLKKIEQFHFDYRQCDDFICVGRGRIEIATPKKLRGEGK
jgi:hypothetical protein